MQSKKKGFTLIELLAVIVILAIIALIAVPVIMNVIGNARKSAFEDSVYGVVKAAELYYAEQLLESEGMTEDKEFVIQDGKFVGKNKLEVSGSIPKSGKVKVTKEGKVAVVLSNGEYYVQKATAEDKLEIKSLKEENQTEEELDYKEETSNNEEVGRTGIFTTSTKNSSIPACITNNTECTVGTGVAIKVNNATTYDFYVISEDTNEGTITLIMNQNLGDKVAWVSEDDYISAGGTEADYGSNGNNNKGPLTALKAVEERTSSWTNIPSKTYTLTDDDTTPMYTSMTRTARARLITYTEATSLECTTSSGSCPTWLYENTYNNGDNSNYCFWTSSVRGDSTNGAWLVDSVGRSNSNYIYYDHSCGVRPVITISKALASE